MGVACLDLWGIIHWINLGFRLLLLLLLLLWLLFRHQNLWLAICFTYSWREFNIVLSEAGHQNRLLSSRRSFISLFSTRAHEILCRVILVDVEIRVKWLLFAVCGNDEKVWVNVGSRNRFSLAIWSVHVCWNHGLFLREMEMGLKNPPIDDFASRGPSRVCVWDFVDKYCGFGSTFGTSDIFIVTFEKQFSKSALWV